jgi:hypothetical protein
VGSKVCWNDDTHFTLERAMSLHLDLIDPIPEETVCVARAAFPQGQSLYADAR